MFGTTATHLACSRTSSGIPLSGAAMTSCSTLPALLSRSVEDSRADCAQLVLARLSKAATIIIFFKFLTLFFCPAQRLFGYSALRARGAFLTIARRG
jgi:hypothetical protein